MIHDALKKLGKLGRMHIGTARCPEIRWAGVERIEALGTDTYGTFEVWLIFHHTDGTEVNLLTHHRGNDRIIESLPQRYPGISPNWYEQMGDEP